MKHNQQIANQHFRKDWQRFVKTWFNQPAKKQARRAARVAKAQKVAPRPLNLLRPVVRCQTVKYNRRQRLGRGFTVEELKAAGISKKEALGIGIAVDFRRQNKSEEAFQQNVQRLNLYKSKLIVFPRNPSSKRVKKGDATRDEMKEARQVGAKSVLAIPFVSKKIAPRKITAEEREANVVAFLRKERTDGKLWGQREQRAKKKAEAAALKSKKKNKGKN
eukprot:NODE_2143_length_1127_cov_10.027000_g2125_i0.p2 GENE.NODE_2143_length_1127_cov_10.027000_g2125_i0~~NODE_2143_length_1127_cov_10.027000_g2125_i0.p2  ORF type:complete len:245 (+),score=101.07 NODE_2143_length_1127_cov_10.027000_g2125_i0:80-736(+)